jgi:hypothetical protein
MFPSIFASSFMVLKVVNACEEYIFSPKNCLINRIQQSLWIQCQISHDHEGVDGGLLGCDAV